MADNPNTTENTKYIDSARPRGMRLLLLSFIILIAGIVIGSASTTLLIQKNSGKIVGSFQRNAGRMTHRLKERLDLSEEQFNKIEPIITEHMDELRDIQEVAHPLISSEISEMKEEISALLTDEQKLLWDRQMMPLERGFEVRGGMRRGGGPGGYGRGPGPRRGGEPRGPGRNRRDGQFGNPEDQMWREELRKSREMHISDQNSWQ
jgi:hypothetical protein